MDCRIKQHKLLLPVHLAEEYVCDFTIFCHYAISVCTALTRQDKTKEVSDQTSVPAHAKNTVYCERLCDIKFGFNNNFYLP